ncbi:MAG: hypothetical protein WD708_09425 [Kiritimatiellia bacterium]
MMSPGKRFSSLKHGDPRAVAFTAVAVFCVSVGWFSWTLFNPQLTENLPLGTGADRRPAADGEFRLSQLIQDQQTADIPGSIPNPFYRTPPDRPAKRPARTPTQTENGSGKTTETTANAEPGKKPVPPPPPPPPPEPVTRPVDITFHGMLIRPDQAAVALISTSDESRRRFLLLGDTLLDRYTIGSITSDGLELQTVDGSPEHLSRGQTLTVEIPK